MHAEILSSIERVSTLAQSGRKCFVAGNPAEAQVEQIEYLVTAWLERGIRSARLAIECRSLTLDPWRRVQVELPESEVFYQSREPAGIQVRESIQVSGVADQIHETL